MAGFRHGSAEVIGRSSIQQRASGVMIGLSGRGEPAQGKAPDHSMPASAGKA